MPVAVDDPSVMLLLTLRDAITADVPIVTLLKVAVPLLMAATAIEALPVTERADNVAVLVAVRLPTVKLFVMAALLADIPPVYVALLALRLPTVRLLVMAALLA